ncbi:MAG: phosphoenolpyruvate--protein phosphotransferase [Candidatus Brocadiae bacterium]|nr:phosphoenolpyruvate--protein phosphotransferase [Candidatus Brocadiia bacterium]
MDIKKGIPVSSGVAIGEAFLLDHEGYRIPKRFISNHPKAVEREKERYRDAVEKAICELQDIEEKNQGNKDIAILFMGHRFIIEDPGIQEEIIEKIESFYYTAEYAVSHTMHKHSYKLKSLPNDYHSKRSIDLEDIENRLLKHLLGGQRENLCNLKNPVILVAKDLTPSETVILPQDRILAFITEIGGRTSHTAIVARTKGIPAVVGVNAATSQIRTGDIVIVDGGKGIVIIDPEPSALEKYRLQQKKEQVRQEKLKTLLNLPVETIDGYTITLRANIEEPTEVKIAMKNGATGIGLYRTEFIYVNEIDPQEETHLSAYKTALKDLKGNKLIIRTLDFGADKNFGLEDFVGEKNPFLGCRSIRLCFEKPDLFKKQLRAILRASSLGDVEIMFPMISSLEELLRAKGILEEVKQDLSKENISYNKNIKVGMMVEIPSVAITADLLVKEVDFFSIGTNDLIQYTLAVDRINERVAPLYKPAHPAIFRLIKRVVDIAKENHVKVSMCGEMSAESHYLVPLMGLGLREFSLSSSIILNAKEMIRKITMRRAKQIAQNLLNCITHEEALEYLDKELG